MSLLENQTVAVLGGTGPQGRGLARRFAAAGADGGDRQPRRRARPGHRRRARRGRPAATSAARTTPTPPPPATSSSSPCRGTATATCSESLADALAGKVVVDCVNPLGFDKQGAFALAGRGGLGRPAGRRAAARRPWSPPSTTSARCCSRTRRSTPSTPTCWCSATTARPPTWSQALADAIPGMRGVYAGRLRNAHQVEALTANLISDQPPLQGPRRPAGHRRLTGRGHAGCRRARPEFTTRLSRAKTGSRS